jgi:hypothetical protein
MDRCTLKEARTLIDAKGLGTALSDEEFARLRTLSDDDLARVSDSRDFFSISESNRRLSSELQREAHSTRVLTAWVVALTVGVLIMTAVLVWVAVRHG